MFSNANRVLTSGGEKSYTRPTPKVVPITSNTPQTPNTPPSPPPLCNLGEIKQFASGKFEEESSWDFNGRRGVRIVGGECHDGYTRIDGAWPQMTSVTSRNLDRLTCGDHHKRVSDISAADWTSADLSDCRLTIPFKVQPWTSRSSCSYVIYENCTQPWEKVFNWKCLIEWWWLNAEIDLHALECLE